MFKINKKRHPIVKYKPIFVIEICILFKIFKLKISTIVN
jgi:hypothetical protein